MKKIPFIAFALLSPLLSLRAETTIKMLHIQNLQPIRDIWAEAAKKFESDHPGVKVEFDYLENEAFKAKLPTLLQSPSDKPSFFHSWGGGVMKEQVESGVCQDITAAIKGDFEDSFYPAGVQNFVVDGKSYGLPNDVGPIVFWYNKDLTSKAGIDPTQIKTWDDFIGAVKKAKAAGLTPIAAGGADKWPLHFYPAMLTMRVLGKDDFNAMLKDTKEGLAGQGSLKAWQLYKELCDLKPFQDGYQSAKYPDAAGYFHDGKAVFHLMGNWDVGEGRADSVTKKGLSDEQLGWINFPTVAGGKGKADDIFASVDGWLVGKDAPKETIDFLKVLLGKETQQKLAAGGHFIPMVKGTADSIQVSYIRDLAKEAEQSGWIQIAIDQLLGPDTGRVFNDQAAAVAAGSSTPEAAVKAVQDSWKQNQG